MSDSMKLKDSTRSTEGPSEFPSKEMIWYASIANKVARLISEKQVAYGDSFGRSAAVMEIFFPNGVPVEKYQDFLAFTRVVDKLFRIANRKEAFGEDPWMDIAGYALLSIDKRSMLDGK